MILLRILAGIGLLVMGGRLFWFFVGLIGFVWGIRIGAHLFSGQPEWMNLAVALVAGVLGALLTLFLQRLAIALVGFAAGAYLTIRLLHVSELGTGMNWLIILIGGIVGVLLMVILFKWALIILSSVIGAALITETVPMGQSVTTFLFIALSVVGVVIQSLFMTRKRS